MPPSPYRTSARRPEEPLPPERVLFAEIVVPAIFVWVASLLRVCGVAFGSAEPDREAALALVLLVALSALIGKEIAARLRSER